MLSAARSRFTLRSAFALLLALFSLGAQPLAAQFVPTPAGVVAPRPAALASTHVTPTPWASVASHSSIPGSQRAGCDGSRMRAASGKKAIGALIGLGGVVISALAFNVFKTTDTQFGPVVEQSVSTPRLAIGLATLGVGGYLYYGSKADIGAWDDALKGLTIGSSTPKEVTDCLGKPRTTSSSTSAGGEASIYTYRAKSAGVDQTYRLTFAKGLLANIEKTATVR